MSGYTSSGTSGSWGEKRREAHRAGKAVGFTFVELLVSLVILVLIMLIMVSMVNATGTIWHQTVSRVQQFREARDAFESITRRLSQATLNTYWDYDNPNAPTKYIRQSELRFVSGPGAAGTYNSATLPPRPTHSVFFQAPLGFVAADAVTTGTAYGGMENLLNSWGYYIEYNSDASFRPTFLSSSTARTRFRLMEFMQSSQSMTLYPLEVASGGNANYAKLSGQTGLTWFLGAGNYTGVGNGNYTGVNTPVTQTAPVHILAENVIALILLPKLTTATQTSGTNNYTDASLAPAYVYNSTGNTVAAGRGGILPTVGDPNLDPINQLPPVVQVTMVAIDEASAMRMNSTQNTALLSELGSLFTDATKYANDLTGTGTPPGLETYLTSKGINFRVFSTEVAIRGAQWSTNQSN